MNSEYKDFIKPKLTVEWDWEIMNDTSFYVVALKLGNEILMQKTFYSRIPVLSETVNPARTKAIELCEKIKGAL